MSRTYVPQLKKRDNFMKRTFLFLFDIILLLSLVAFPAFAHPGRTDQYGGHMDHSTGEYHYHDAPDSSHSGGSSSGSSTNRDADEAKHALMQSIRDAG